MNGDPFDGVMGSRRGSERQDVPVAHLAGQFARWWRVDEDEATHMDLRRWFDERFEEGWRVMRVDAAPGPFIRTGKALHRVVLLGSRARHRERVLWPSEHDWLLRTWPEELRTHGPREGLLAP